MKSSLKNMVVVLFSITFISSLCVGLVNKITSQSIENAKLENVKEALKNVLPEFDENSMKDMTVDGLPVTVYSATKAGEPVGYAVETMTDKGFSGVFRLMVGFDASGKVYNINVLEHNETPGLGSKMTEPENPLLMSFKGKNPSEMKQPLAVTKDGGDVQALTAATISSRAYVDAVARAYNAVQELLGNAPVKKSEARELTDAEKALTSANNDGVTSATATGSYDQAASETEVNNDGVTSATSTDGYDAASSENEATQKGGSDE